MKFAVIPWAEKYSNNEIFNVSSSTNRNGLAEPYAEMKAYIDSTGNEINTIDRYPDLSEVDFFLFFDWFPKWIYKLSKMGLSSRMVYCNAEPPTVKSMNTYEGYKRVMRYFPYLMTWNKDIVDNKRIFYRTIPYCFTSHDNKVPFEDKKLLTSISANKKSDYVDELYTEREKLISYFEENMPDQFDMYGVGWDNTGHKSYKGSPENKFDVYPNYKFALAFENTKNVRGYVTEKIFDCLSGGIVPIYYGAEDICDYVSEESFIDYRKFESLEKLKYFLESISKEEYEKYLRAGRDAVESSELRYQFSGRMYGENIFELVKKAKLHDFNVKRRDLALLILSDLFHKAADKVRGLIRKLQF